MKPLFTEKEHQMEIIDEELHQMWLFTNKKRKVAIYVELVQDGINYTASAPEEILCAYPDGVQKRLDYEYTEGCNSIVYLSMIPGTTPDCVIIQNAFAEKIEDVKKMIEKPFPYKFVWVDADHPEQFEMIER